MDRTWWLIGKKGEGKTPSSGGGILGNGHALAEAGV